MPSIIDVLSGRSSADAEKQKQLIMELRKATQGAGLFFPDAPVSLVDAKKYAEPLLKKMADQQQAQSQSQVARNTAVGQSLPAFASALQQFQPPEVAQRALSAVPLSSIDPSILKQQPQANSLNLMSYMGGGGQPLSSQEFADRLMPKAEKEASLQFVGTDPNTNSPILFNPKTGTTQLGKLPEGVKEIAPRTMNINQPTKEQTAILAKQLAEGDLTPNMLPKRGNTWTTLMAEAKKINPEFDPAKAQLNFQAKQRFLSTENTGSQLMKIQLIASVEKHLNTLERISDDYKRYENIPMNKIQNYIGRELGSTVVSKYMTASQETTSQLAQIFSGTAVTTDFKYKQALQALSADQTIGQIKSNASVLREFLKNRKDALTEYKPILIPEKGNPQAQPQGETITLEDYLKSKGH